jgi:hypothetical protein
MKQVTQKAMILITIVFTSSIFALDSNDCYRHYKSLAKNLIASTQTSQNDLANYNNTIVRALINLEEEVNGSYFDQHDQFVATINNNVNVGSQIITELGRKTNNGAIEYNKLTSECDNIFSK